MSKALLTVVAAAIIASAGATMVLPAKADGDASMNRRHVSNRYCQQIWRCGPAGCNWHRVCSRLCPDGSYTCSALYGAYGPYGGVSYWGGYTDAGWSYYR